MITFLFRFCNFAYVSYSSKVVSASFITLHLLFLFLRIIIGSTRRVNLPRCRPKSCKGDWHSMDIRPVLYQISIICTCSKDMLGQGTDERRPQR